MRRSLIPLAIALSPLAGCAPGTVRAAEAPAAQTLSVTASDFAFALPDTVAAGLTTIRLQNAGQELHHVQLIRLEDGHTFPELMEAMKAGGPPPAWAVDVGGPNTPVPGGASETTVMLEPGNYVLACFIPSPDGVPHIAKGMVKPLVVAATAGAATAAEEPRADVRIRLTDYAFGIEGELTAGRRTVRVETGPGQSHEVFFVKLAPGKTAMDMVRWTETQQGPPPGRPVGGTTAIRAGGVNYVTADFEAGEYALLCFIPDARDGKPHVAHGMVRQVTVR